MNKWSFLIPLGLAAIFYLGRWIYMKPKFDKGDAAINFSEQLLSGEQFSLSDLKGKYVLLDFWGSWCGPCRAESPMLVELNKTFGSKKMTDAEGFEIVSVGIENNKANWVKAIEQDQLSWKHHIFQNQSFNSPIAKLYRVREIPTKYLLDTQGNVLFTNPSFQQIIEFLSSKVVSN